jgi:hypothetical protein
MSFATEYSDLYYNQPPKKMLMERPLGRLTTWRTIVMGKGNEKQFQGYEMKKRFSG